MGACQTCPRDHRPRLQRGENVSNGERKVEPEGTGRNAVGTQHHVKLLMGDDNTPCGESTAALARSLSSGKGKGLLTLKLSRTSLQPQVEVVSGVAAALLSAGPPTHLTLELSCTPATPSAASPSSPASPSSTSSLSCCEHLPPEHLECPVGLVLMRDPVMLRCGHSFDRSSILQVMSGEGAGGGRKMCPLCRQQVAGDGDIVPNYAVRQAVDHWLRQHPGK